MNVFWRAASSAACSCRRPEAAGRARDCSLLCLRASRPARCQGFGGSCRSALDPPTASALQQFRGDGGRPSAMIGHAASISSLTPSPVTAEILKNGSFSFFARFSSAVDALRIVDRVDLVGGDQLRLLEQLRVVELELAANRVEVLDRIASRRARHVDEVNQHLGALDVAQELMAEAVALVRAFDQARARRRRRSCDRRSARPRRGSASAW